MNEEKILENRLRLIAQRRGLLLQKSRRRDTNALDYGRFMLVDFASNTVVAGGEPYAYSLSLADVEALLTQPASRPPVKLNFQRSRAARF